MLTFADALHQVATDAQSKLPAAVHERLAKGLLLAEQGHVWVEEDGKHGMVLSQDGQRWHVVNAACDCPDAQYRAEMTLGLCCHRLAFGLVRRAGELMHQPPPGAEAAPAVQVSAPLPEAPASVNVRLMIDGRECQWTLRDTDEARLAERLAALLARYPVEATYPRSPSAPATETPVCPTHGPMKPSTKAPGSFYCTKKLYSGAYCQERYPAQGA
jgi:hypothetical protein